MYITLPQVKNQLNLDESFNEDDNLLRLYIQAAENVVEHHINRSLCQVAEENNGILPQQVQIAVMMLVGSFYNSRESQSYASISANPAYHYILASVKRYAVPSDRRPHRHFPIFHPNNHHHF